jgi:hypothetical protein
MVYLLAGDMLKLITKQKVKKFNAVFPKECKPGYNSATCTPMFTTALFTIAKLWKHPRCSTTNE